MYIPVLTVSGFASCAKQEEFINNKLKRQGATKQITFFIFLFFTKTKIRE
jgi:hypothetical protein